MKKPKTKLKRRRRSVKPAAKRKRKAFASRSALGKSKVPAAQRPAPTQPLPELEIIPTRPLFAAPRTPCFLGGGTAMPAGFLPEGFVPVSKHKPAGYRAAEFRSYRTFPDGEFLRCVRYELKPGTVGHDFKAEEMPHIPAGKFFIQNGNDGPVLSVHCVCNSNLVRIGKRGSATCSKCGAVYVAPTDRTGLPIVNSQGMKETFFPSALPRERYHNFVKIV
jgi:hypothetical protein